MPHARLTRLPTAAPDDVSGFLDAIARGAIDPHAIRAVLAKTEGNGCVNDFTRAFAVSALRAALAPHLSPDAIAAISIVASGGTEGGLSPHWLVLEALEGDHPMPGPALAMGVAVTRPLAPEEIGRMAQVRLVREALRAAMDRAALHDPADVHYVQVKCPLLTADKIEAAARRGVTPATTDTLRSMGLSRGACALGVALALGEVAEGAVTDAAIGSAFDLHSSRASCSAGVELETCEIVVLGTSPAWSGPLAIDHAVMADGIDIEPVRAALARLGLPTQGQLETARRERLVALLAKAEASTSGRLRGSRHTMRDDSDISATRHARAYAAGALGALVGHGALFVSGGAEHQGPDGGGPCALVVLRDPEASPRPAAS